MQAVLGHWAEARYLAVTVLEQQPDLSEAHYLMGVVYQHEGDWEKAAQEYRAALAGEGRWRPIPINSVNKESH